ncbi:hypothetical protein ACNS7O_18310 (plasmid) [Haloferacaceae archaeon DSL9]
MSSVHQLGAEEQSAFDVHRDRVQRPLLRLVGEYGADEIRWVAIGMAANVVARVASLVPLMARPS